jgi:dephospho-CoA kinase
MFEQRVFVNLQMEALHAFFGAENPEFKEVEYLKYPHRHLFGFKVELEVTHDDRDVEFIMFKHQIQNMLRQRYYNEEIDMLDFTGKSCEMLAKEIIEYCLELCLLPKEVWVNEDGENGAHVIWNEVKPDWNEPEKCEQLELPLESQPKVYVVVGYTGAGKSTISHLLSNVTGYEVVEVSSLIEKINEYIIRNKKAASERMGLANSISSSELAIELDEYIRLDEGRSIIISGLRDYETYKMLVEKYGRGNFHVIKVDTLPQECALRLGMSLNEYMRGPAQIDINLKVTDIMADANYVHKNG